MFPAIEVVILSLAKHRTLTRDGLSVVYAIVLSHPDQLNA